MVQIVDHWVTVHLGVLILHYIFFMDVANLGILGDTILNENFLKLQRTLPRKPLVQHRMMLITTISTTLITSTHMEYSTRFIPSSTTSKMI